MRPVEREQAEHRVVGGEGGDLGALSGHQLRFPRGRFTRGLLILLAEAVYLGLLFTPDARSRLPAYLLLSAAAGVLSLLAAAILSGSPATLAIACACLFRATLLLRPPDLSDDLARYLWDARVSAAGFSPWAYAPEDPALAGVGPDLRQRVAHRDVKTVYPPVAQAAFRLGSLEGQSGIALKFLFSLADVAIVWLLARTASVSAAALYAFHPLPVLEIAGQGHLDPLGVALLIAALGLLAQRRRVLSGIAYGLSVLTKYVALAAVIPVGRRGGWRLLASGFAVAAGLWLAASRGGVSPAGGLSDYATRWDFNSPLYGAAARAVTSFDLPARAKADFLAWKERHGHPAWTQRVFPYFYEGFFARALLAGVLASALIGIGWRVRDLRSATFASLGALLIFSPTVHPWYLLWILPFAAERREPAFLYLSFAAPLAYGLLYATPGLSPARILSLEYVPFLFLLAATLARAARRRRAS